MAVHAAFLFVSMDGDASLQCKCGWCSVDVGDSTPAGMWAIEQAHLRDVGQEGAPTPVPVHRPPAAPAGRPNTNHADG